MSGALALLQARGWPRPDFRESFFESCGGVAKARKLPKVAGWAERWRPFFYIFEREPPIRPPRYAGWQRGTISPGKKTCQGQKSLESRQVRVSCCPDAAFHHLPPRKRSDFSRAIRASRGKLQLWRDTFAKVSRKFRESCGVVQRKNERKVALT